MHVCARVRIYTLLTFDPCQWSVSLKQHHSRIEGGMLSYGQDMDIEVNPFEPQTAFASARGKVQAPGRSIEAKCAP